MPQIDNLNRSEHKNQALRQSANDTMAPLGSTAVSTPGNSTRFIGLESLKVIGSAIVSGLLAVTGTLRVSGLFEMVGNLVASGTSLFTGAFTSRGVTRFEGDTTQVGPLHILGNVDSTGDWVQKGKFKVEGDQENTGKLAIKGETTLEALVRLSDDLQVEEDGTITILGAMPLTLGIGPNALPAMFFGSGGSFEGTPGGARIVGSGAAYMDIGSTNAQMVSGSNYVRVTPTGTMVGGTLEALAAFIARGRIDLRGTTYIQGATVLSTATPNVYIDSFGRVFKTS